MFLAGVRFQVEQPGLQGPEAFADVLVPPAADGHRVVAGVDEELAAAVDPGAGQAGDVSAQQALDVVAEVAPVRR
ncbi:MAG TPA: hypothetical protein VFO85_07900 [Vicinamibacteria bacterium]|nr:hypothetical protein [Vicinamibacteria bacterium]